MAGYGKSYTIKPVTDEQVYMTSFQLWQVYLAIQQIFHVIIGYYIQ
jgi:hypothetical protein